MSNGVRSKYEKRVEETTSREERKRRRKTRNVKKR